MVVVSNDWVLPERSLTQQTKFCALLATLYDEMLDGILQDLHFI